jgi:hypothetical protein
MSTQQQSDQVEDRDANIKYDMEMTLHGLKGIFWALNVLTDGGVETGRSDEEREGCIVGLIVAGKMLTDEFSRRF